MHFWLYIRTQHCLNSLDLLGKWAQGQEVAISPPLTKYLCRPSPECPAFKRSWSPSDCSAPASTGKATSPSPWAAPGQSTPAREPQTAAWRWGRRCWELWAPWELSVPRSCGDPRLAPSWWPCPHQRTKGAWGSSTSCSDGWRRRRSVSVTRTFRSSARDSFHYQSIYCLFA